MNALTELAAKACRQMTAALSNSPTRRRRRSRRSAIAERLERRTLLASQIVSTTPEAQTVAFGEDVVVNMNYDVSDSSVSALSFGVLVHYDSSVLTYGGERPVFAPGDPTIQEGPETQSDNDPDTDRVVSISWGNGTPWPPAVLNLPILLGDVGFRAASTETVTSLNITNSDPDPVYDFIAAPVSVTIQPPTFTVGPSLSLSDAITAANAATTRSVIDFDPTVSEISLTEGLPELTNDISIVGPGAKQLTISAAASQRHFSVASDSTVNISGLTLDGADTGGGISNRGTLNLHEVAIRNVRHSSGSADGNSGQGGAITNDGGMLKVSNSELSGNIAQTGGGIYNSGTAIVTNSTVSGNSVADAGGGITTTGGGNTTLRNVTVTNNTAGRNGGLLNDTGSTTEVRNSIVVGNFISGGTSPESFPASITDVMGSITSGSASAIIGPLKDNGGPTQTHELITGSTAIDAGIDDQAVITNGDQRGRARIAGDRVDAGAFEIVPNPGFTVTNPATTTVGESDSSVSLSVVLDAPPAGTVVLDITSSDETEAKPRFRSVSFGPDNWNTPQTVPIEGVADGEVDGDQTSTITISVDQAASDDVFDSLGDHTFSITTTDDGTTAIAAFDIDGDGIVNPFIDANLIFLWMSQGTPDETFESLIFSGAADNRNSAAEIREATQTLNGTNMALDVDGDGIINPFIDANLIFLWMSQGTPDETFESLIFSGAADDRNSGEEIRKYLDGLLAPTSAVAAPRTAAVLPANPRKENSPPTLFPSTLPEFDRELLVSHHVPAALEQKVEATGKPAAKAFKSSFADAKTIFDFEDAGPSQSHESDVEEFFELSALTPNWGVL